VAAVRTSAPFALAATALLFVGYLPAADPWKSWRPVARAAEAAAAGGPVYHAGFNQGPNLLWALDRATTPPLPDRAAFTGAFGTGRPRAAIVATAAWWDEQRAAAASDAALAAAVGTLREVWRDQADRRLLIVLTNAPP
jgi:hypothetical protein